jgi:hypothetical protein
MSQRNGYSASHSYIWLVGTGTSPEDLLLLGDSLVVILVAGLDANDSLTFSETSQGHRTTTVELAEELSLMDSSSATLVVTQEWSDSFTLSDDLRVETSDLNPLADLLSLADECMAVTMRVSQASTLLSFSDDVAYLAVLGVSTDTDTIVLSDSVSATSVFQASAADLTTFTDVMEWDHYTNGDFSDTVTFTDAFANWRLISTDINMSLVFDDTATFSHSIFPALNTEVLTLTSAFTGSLVVTGRGLPKSLPFSLVRSSRSGTTNF